MGVKFCTSNNWDLKVSNECQAEAGGKSEREGGCFGAEGLRMIISVAMWSPFELLGKNNLKHITTIDLEELNSFLNYNFYFLNETQSNG